MAHDRGIELPSCAPELYNYVAVFLIFEQLTMVSFFQHHLNLSSINCVYKRNNMGLVMPYEFPRVLSILYYLDIYITNILIRIRVPYMYISVKDWLPSIHTIYYIHTVFIDLSIYQLWVSNVTYYLTSTPIDTSIRNTENPSPHINRNCLKQLWNTLPKCIMMAPISMSISLNNLEVVQAKTHAELQPPPSCSCIACI